MSKINLDHFERKVVFRTARGYFIVIAAIAILTFGLGAAFGMKALTHIEPSAPEEPAEPMPIAPPAALTLEELRAWQQRPAPAEDEEEALPKFAQEQPDELADAKANDAPDPVVTAFSKLKALFPAPDYAWESEYREECTRPSAYGCLRRERILQRKGVSSILFELIKNHEDDDKQEFVLLADSLVTALTPVPVAERGALIADTVYAHRHRLADYETKVQEQILTKLEQQQAYERALEEHGAEVAEIEAERKEDFSVAGYGLAMGLGLLACVGVFLAHLAIERHLRELQEILKPRS